MEEHLLPVGSPSRSDIHARMPREPLGLAAVRGHYKDIHVSVVLSSKGDPLAVWRKHRRTLMTARGDLPRVSTFSRNTPQVAAISEDHLRFAERRGVRQQRRFLRRLRYSRATQRQQGAAKDCHSNAHLSSKKHCELPVA